MPFAVDFSLAKQLDRTGTTCDTFECTIQHRHLFIKRLKAKFRDNPLYRAAFEKEYELGVGLNHMSLPRYVGFGDDYIVMDFIEGDTLADLIKRKDTRLKNKRFVKKLLSELIDVVEYLHNRRVVHCDIKPDNIIISPHNDRRLTLIDLDKAYTSWLETTHGNPEKYGCSGCADGQIDFKGIGLIAEKLGMKRIARACKKGGVTTGDLPKQLISNQNLILAIIATLAILAILAIIADILGKKETQSEFALVSEEAFPEVAIVDSLSRDASDPQMVEKTRPADLKKNIPESKSLDEIVKTHYDPLYKRHEFLLTLVADSTTTDDMIFNAYRSYADQQREAQSAIFADIMEKYALSDALEASAILGSSNEWGRFMRADFEINDMVGKAIRQRESIRESQ